MEINHDDWTREKHVLHMGVPWLCGAVDGEGQNEKDPRTVVHVLAHLRAEG